PINIDRNDRAHLLQHVDEVKDLRFDRSAPQLGLPARLNRSQKRLLGRAYRRIRQADRRTLQALGRGNVNAPALLLLDAGTELLEDTQMEVDGAPPNLTPAKIRNVGLPEAVEQRAAKENGDTRGTRMFTYRFHLRRGDQRRID